MNVVFTVDNYFYRDTNGTIYSKGLYPYSVWQRYLAVFQKITVVARITEFTPTDNIEKMNISSGPNVSFVEIPSLSSPVTQITHKREAKARLRHVIAHSDGVIARVPSETSFLAVEVSKSLGKPWAVEVVSCAWDSYWNYGNMYGKLYAPIVMNKTKRVVSESKYSLYVTSEFLQKRYPSRGMKVNCSNVEIPYARQDILLKRLNRIEHGSKTINIGMIGFLGTNIKGVDTVLKALHYAKDSLPDYQFKILGGGDQIQWREMAKKLSLGDRVTFYGVLPSGNPVYHWLDDIDLYLHPSRQEGLPRALIEAMSRGCPAIGSTVGGIPELLPSECMHKPGDYKKLANILTLGLHSLDWQKQMAEKNFYAAREYSRGILNKKRNEFWTLFAQNLTNSKINQLQVTSKIGRGE